jgi:hypothetical protein
MPALNMASDGTHRGLVDSAQFTININKAPTAPATVKVAYFVISAS